jgi:glycerate kinase
LEARLRAADLVVTGEGSIDGSTLMGKGVGELAAACAQAGVPCVGLAGVVPDREKALARFAGVHAMVPDLTTSAQAMAKPSVWLERLAARAAAVPPIQPR